MSESASPPVLPQRPKAADRLPWIVLLTSLGVVLARLPWKWTLPYGAHEFAPRPGEVIEFWVTGTTLVFFLGLPASAFPASSCRSRVRRFVWAWAVWTAFCAAVPPRGQNFTSSGAADDIIFVYAPAAAASLAAMWFLHLLARELGVAGPLLALAVVSGMSYLLFGLVGGAGLDEPLGQAAATAWFSLVCALLVLAVKWVRRGRSAPGT